MTSEGPGTGRESTKSAQTEKRIGWLTPCVGTLAAGAALAVHRQEWALGLAIGSGLGWLNFRWMKRAADALVTASQAQAGRESPRIPLSVYVLAALRYGLIGLSVYVIFIYLHVPLASLVLGLCALGAATIAASVWEITSSSE